MSTPAPLWPAPSHDPEAGQHTLAEGVQRTVAIARALAGTGRQVDLAGLDGAVGLLCARTLDLPPDRGRAVRPVLAAILTELDQLGATLRAEGPA